MARKNSEIHVILSILIAIITDVLAFVSNFSLYRILTHFNKSCSATYFNNQILVSHLFYPVNCCDFVVTPPGDNIITFVLNCENFVTRESDWRPTNRKVDCFILQERFDLE